MRIGDAALSHKATNRKGAPSFRRPAEILDIDEPGAAAKFQSRISKVARLSARRSAEEKDVEDVEDWDCGSVSVGEQFFSV